MNRLLFLFLLLARRSTWRCFARSCPTSASATSPIRTFRHSSTRRTSTETDEFRWRVSGEIVDSRFSLGSVESRQARHVALAHAPYVFLLYRIQTSGECSRTAPPHLPPRPPEQLLRKSNPAEITRSEYRHQTQRMHTFDIHIHLDCSSSASHRVDPCRRKLARILVARARFSWIDLPLGDLAFPPHDQRSGVAWVTAGRAGVISDSTEQLLVD